MKKCPHCAEDIQKAALVCKHCRRDITPPAPPAKPRSEMSGRELLVATPKRKGGTGRALLIVAAVIAAFFLLSYFVTDHQAFQVFAAKRDAWHHRCDAPRAAGRMADPERYDACAEDLTALVAEAKAHGWN